MAAAGVAAEVDAEGSAAGAAEVAEEVAPHSEAEVAAADTAAAALTAAGSAAEAEEQVSEVVAEAVAARVASAPTRRRVAAGTRRGETKARGEDVLARPSRMPPVRIKSRAAAAVKPLAPLNAAPRLSQRRRSPLNSLRFPRRGWRWRRCVTCSPPRRLR